MRGVIALCVLVVGCSSGDQGAPGNEGAQGEVGQAGAKGDRGETGPSGSHARWVDGDGDPIERFAMLSLTGFAGLSPEKLPVVFDADGNIWIVELDTTTLDASAHALEYPFLAVSYTGADCTGDGVIPATSSVPRNVPFYLASDSATVRRFPAANPTTIAVQSTFLLTDCINSASNVTGYRVSETTTTLTPPTLTWKGPIEAHRVE